MKSETMARNIVYELWGPYSTWSTQTRIDAERTIARLEHLIRVAKKEEAARLMAAPVESDPYEDDDGPRSW